MDSLQKIKCRVNATWYEALEDEEGQKDKKEDRNNWVLYTYMCNISVSLLTYTDTVESITSIATTQTAASRVTMEGKRIFELIASGLWCTKYFCVNKDIRQYQQPS